MTSSNSATWVDDRDKTTSSTDTYGTCPFCDAVIGDGGTRLRDHIGTCPQSPHTPATSLSDYT